MRSTIRLSPALRRRWNRTLQFSPTAKLAETERAFAEWMSRQQQSPT
jgi:hypothetical protein